MSVGELRRAVCVVEQDSFVFSGTLHENIRYGRPDADAEAVRQARQLAGLTPDLGFGPVDTDVELGEGGRELSGGERQRIAIARAILRDPAILVLDEATSALDSETEATIIDRMSSWLSRRTVICISHRFSTIARIRRVLVLETGRLVADGEVERLVQTSSTFRELFREQIAALHEPTMALAGSGARDGRRWDGPAES
jgi:ATP-binding cassette subfamily B protein